MEISITWNICRVCLVEEDKKPQTGSAAESMRHIFNEDKMLAKQIYECSGITMNPDDNLPEKICKKCFTMVKYAVNFRKTCRASDTYLQNVLQRTRKASALFRPGQPSSQDSLEEVDDCLENDDPDKDENEIGMSKENKRRETHLGKSSKTLEESEFSEIKYFSDILIESENEDNINVNDLNNTIAENDTLECTDSCADDEAATTFEQNDESVQIDSRSRITVNQNDPLNEVTDQEKDISEENRESESLENNDDPFLSSSEKEDEDNAESCIQEFIRLEEEILQDEDSETDDNPALVSSTVAIKGDEENSNLSTESNGMQTEYIIDEYQNDDNSSDNISLRNSTVVVVQSKLLKNVRNKKQTITKHTKATAIRKALSKPGSNQVWICELCNNHFSNRQLLNAHMKVHRQEKNHECEICFKRFITACNLQAHMRIHTGEKPFECQYCGRRFSDRSANLRHERTHTNERPFVCNECGKAFSLATTLKKHQAIHTGERSYRCDTCAKSFKLPHQLKAHKNSTLHKAVEQLTEMDQDE